MVGGELLSTAFSCFRQAEPWWSPAGNGTVVWMLSGVDEATSSGLRDASAVKCDVNWAEEDWRKRLLSFFLLFGRVSPASFPLAATPTQRVTYPSHGTPRCVQLMQEGRVRSHFLPRRRQVLHAVGNDAFWLILPPHQVSATSQNWRVMAMVTNRKDGRIFLEHCPQSRTPVGNAPTTA